MAPEGDSGMSKLEEQLEEADALLEDDPGAAIELLEDLRKEHPEEEVIVLMLADAQAGADQPVSARQTLEEWLSSHPMSADAHHALGVLLDWLGEEKRCVEEFLETLRLDDESWRRGPPLGDAFEERMVQIVHRTVLDLPPRLRQLLVAVPIVLEDRPSRDLVEEGFDPRALGLFEGATQEESSSADPSIAPTRIVLYSANLAAEFPEAEELEEQLRFTVLHEVGHFFGLDEERLDALGLT
jgi:predicted Zn-dependent protease with MMP-like domain